MATVAVFWRPGKPGSVAQCAGNRGMLPSQGEACFIVVESGAAPGAGAVAHGAIGGEALRKVVRRLVVVLLVAGETIGRSANRGTYVAFGALPPGVCAIQRKASIRMVECRRYPP